MFNLISCDKCGYLDSFDKFLDETQPDFFDRMKILGWNLENPNTMSYFQTMYAVPQQVSVESYYDMWKFLGIGSDLAGRVKIQTKAYQTNSEIQEFIKTVYEQTLKMF